MEAERFRRLEALEATNDPIEQAHHLSIARWIKGFLDPVVGIEAELRTNHSLNLEAARAAKHPQPVERPYMETDSHPALND